MRSRISLFAFAMTLAGAGAGHLGHPAQARATMTPTTIQWQYCCSRGSNRCCGNNYCAITPAGCTAG